MVAGRILIVSPVPSEPRDQGNSARIAAFGEAIQSAGWIVHFLYHKLEGLDPAQAEAMAKCWDHFHVMDGPPRATRAPDGQPFALDDWSDPALTEFARGLHLRWRFAAVVTNYVWCSAVFEAFDGDVVRVLDTHDVFGGRDARFRELGLPPEWYYTTPEEEARGLRRADIVLAIQEEEALIFRALGHPDVRTLGHLMPCRRRMPKPLDRAKPTAGYLASGNPLNLSAFVQLRDATRAWRGRLRIGRWVLAGQICKRASDISPFVAMGIVERTESFYDMIDIVMNPMQGGTGLKIKSVEAVHLGAPLVATAAAMVGLPVTHEAHCLAGPAELVNYLQATRWTADMLLELRAASECCALEYTDTVRAAYRWLINDLSVHPRRS